MIVGTVNAGEGRIRLTVAGLRGREAQIHAIIDTGYTEWLTLPSSLIAELGLRWQSLDRGMLADGSEALFDVYVGKIVWDGRVRRILADEADTDPLVGMALLRGYELKMQIRSRGRLLSSDCPRDARPDEELC